MSEREYCEKTTLLNKCGEALFGCSGELLVTQGIYVPKSLTSSSSHCLCKRTVWVPDSLSLECLAKYLGSFGATLPFSVHRVASLHRFGLCGVNPTRTAYAKDKHFFLLAKVPHNQFAVYGIVEIRQIHPKRTIIIINISTTKEDVLSSVEWIKSDTTLYHLSKNPKNKGVCYGVCSDHDAQVIEGEREKLTIMQGLEQDPTEHCSSETERDLSVNTFEYPCLHECELCNPSSGMFIGYHLQSPNPLLWVPYLVQQNTSEAPDDSNPSFVYSSSFQ